MLCGCQGKKRAEMEHNQDSMDSPLQVRVVKMLGLKNYLLDKFVFRRKKSSYSIRNIQDKPTLFIEEEKYAPPYAYTMSTHIIQHQSNSVPIVRLAPLYVPPFQTLPTIIYAHGNSSDLGDSLHFLSKMAQRCTAEYVAFDYTGYGQSRKKQVGQQVICKDLQIVLAWLKVPLESIVLWGFSLGSFPTVVNASKYKVGACILQCPIGSLSCMFYDQYASNVKFKDDHFANIDYIANINSRIMMMHSLADEIIPIQQARLLYQKYIARKGEKKIQYIQVQKIKHNMMHRYISAETSNELQKEVLNFIDGVKWAISQTQNTIQTSQSAIEKNPFPEELLKLQASILQVQRQEFYFEQKEFEIVETGETTTTKSKQSTQKGWFCCME